LTRRPVPNVVTLRLRAGTLLDSKVFCLVRENKSIEKEQASTLMKRLCRSAMALKTRRVRKVLMTSSTPRKRVFVRTQRHRRAFSLVEVVLALGIFIFAGFALVGLLGVGLQNGSDSKQALQAATIAEAICSTRQAAPTADFTVGGSAQPNFPLPILSAPSVSNNISPLKPVYLTWDGAQTTLASGTARFGLLYNIDVPANYVKSVSPGAAPVYLYVYWPAQAVPTAAGTSHFELTTTFALP
jgi:type II secretory pathway pseudopilin PulG